MEPAPVLAEAARLLRPGGVFAAYDYDVPGLVHPEVDVAFGRHFAARRAARERLGLEAGASRHPKDQHVQRIDQSGLFALARELVCHGWYETDAKRTIGMARSIGGPLAIFGGAAPEVEETLAQLRIVAERVLGRRPAQLMLGYRIRLGLRRTG
jgi:hypothetical protein